MKNTSTLLLVLFTIINISNAQTQKGTDIDGETADDNSGSCVNMPDHNTVAIGGVYNDGNGSNAGHVRIYRWNGSTWVQKGADIDGEAANDWSGNSVSMPDSNTVAIGAHPNDGNGSNAGHVRIYQWIGNTWTQKGSDIDGEAMDDFSGYSVSMPDSNTIAIGAYSNDGNGINAGHVRIYYWNGNAWLQKGTDIDGEAANDLSGSSLDMPDSNTLAIGAPVNDGNGTNAGHVRIYHWNGSVWMQKGSDIDGEASFDQSGKSISMPDSNTVAIGADLNDGNGSDAGHVRIFQWIGSAWVQKGSDIDAEAAGDNFGYMLSMPDKNILAIGARFNDDNGSNAGHIRIFRWNGSAWIQIGNDIDGESAGDFSGWSVSMPDSNIIAIGAPENDGNGMDAGHTRVYFAASNVGVLENNFGNILVVYPNPTYNEINIDLGKSYNNINVIIKNSLGQNIVSKSYTSSNILQLDIPGDAGVHFIEVTSGVKKTILKVIKEKRL